MINESDITATLIIDGFIEDALLSINSLLEYCDVPIYLLVNGKQDFFALENLSPRVKINYVKQKLGWSNAVNLLLEQVPTNYLVLMDSSTRLVGNPFPPVLENSVVVLLESAGREV